MCRWRTTLRPRKPSKQTDADEECEFTDQPQGWAKPYRFLALRYDKAAREKKNDKNKNKKKPDTNEAEQYQLFNTAPYEYRVYVLPDETALEGQYEYPKGLFFGGKHLEQGSHKYQAFLAKRLASVKRVIAIDVHTGIGNYGEDILMVEPNDYSKIQPLFGERVVPPDPEKSDSYPVRGALDTMFGRALPQAEIFAVTQEFGTYSPTKVLHALREENRRHHYGGGTIGHSTKKILKDTFCPEDTTWRQSILKRGVDLLNQALAS